MFAIVELSRSASFDLLRRGSARPALAFEVGVRVVPPQLFSGDVTQLCAPPSLWTSRGGVVLGPLEVDAVVDALVVLDQVGEVLEPRTWTLSPPWWPKSNTKSGKYCCRSFLLKAVW